MQSWKPIFTKGVASFRAGHLEDSLLHFTEAIRLGGNDFVLFDCRACVYEKLGRAKDSLLDTKMAIRISPDHWKSYARCARLLLKLGKLDSATVMADRATERLADNDSKRRAEIASLKQQISEAQVVKSNNFYHFGKLPVEIAVTIFSLALEEDHPKVVVLAQVCKAWRNTILNAASLWSTLCLSRRNPARKATLWRSRCKGRLGTLQIRGAHESLVRALERLSDVPLNRLRTLSIEGLSLETLRISLPSFTPVILCNLRTINVQNVDASWFWNHPGMQVQNLAACASPMDWYKLENHCHYLQKLSFEGEIKRSDIPHLLSLLKGNEGLTCLDLMSPISQHWTPPYQPDEEDSQPPLIPMPHLTHLMLGGECPSPSYLISRLSLPVLRVLRIMKFPETLDNVLQHLISTDVAKSLCELRLECTFTSADAIIELLRKAEGLQLLGLSSLGSKQVNRVVKELATSPTSDSDGSQPMLCPALTHLDFSYSPDLQSGPVVQLVKSRLPSAGTEDSSGTRAPPVSIESLTLDGCLLIDADILPWLRSKIPKFSCAYMTKKQASWKR